jgi:hypothetical protein
MNLRHDNKSTYLGFLNNLKVNEDVLDEISLVTLIQQYKRMSGLLQPSVPISFIIDYTNMEYLY